MARKALPALYVALGIGNPAVIAASLALLALELAIWDGHDGPLALIHMAIASALPFPAGAAVEAALIPIADQALKAEPNNPPAAYAAPLIAAAALEYLLVGPLPAAQAAIPLAYLAAAYLAGLARLSLARTEAAASQELSTVAGTPLRYSLKVTTRPRAAVAGVEAPREAAVNAVAEEGDGVLLDLTATYDLGGVYSPQIKLRLRDSRGLATAEKALRHPSIAVIPRTQWATEAAQAALAASPRGAEDLLDIKEYAPGDPVSKIHWKKTAQLDELVIKVLGEPRAPSGVVAFSYASNAAKLDRVGSAIVLAAARAAAAGGETNIVLLGPRGEERAVRASRYNFADAVKEALAGLVDLRVRVVGGGDYAGYLAPLQDALLGRVESIVARMGNPVVVGDGDLIGWICSELRLNCILA